MHINLPPTLEKCNFYYKKPFEIFIIDNFLEWDDYFNLSEEVNSITNYSEVFYGEGEKQKTSITGGNIKNISYPALTEFCRSIINDEFYQFFLNTHLDKFSSKLFRKHIIAPESFMFRVARRLKNILRLPLSFFHIEVEVSQIPPGGRIIPHTDSKSKRLSLVLYLPSNRFEEKDSKVLGTIFYGKRRRTSDIRKFDCKMLNNEEEKEFNNRYEAVHVADYKKNRCAGFIKNDISWHGVEVNSTKYARCAIVINIFES